MKAPKRYVGIYKDQYGGMTDTGKIIRDAWIFEIIPEDETCEGWLPQGIEELWRKTQEHWERHGYSVSDLPQDIQARFYRIQEAALERARRAGWAPELYEDE